ncbi:MAG: 5-formyltetrahydrofolate cyclo-ligase [Sinimarinibacterium sp.]
MRRELRLRRASVSAAARAAAAQAAARSLCRLRIWKRARHVGIYLASGSELPTKPVIEHAWGRAKRVYVPRVGSKGEMCFVELRRGSRLHRNRYGIAEPAMTTRGRTAKQIDLLLAPLVGFDARGYRLGAGGGYYDRFLAGRRYHRPLCLGWALALQEIDAVPHDSWDQRLDGIVTEKGLVWPTG